jgi:hypothetical protein
MLTCNQSDLRISGGPDFPQQPSILILFQRKFWNTAPVYYKKFRELQSELLAKLSYLFLLKQINIMHFCVLIKLVNDVTIPNICCSLMELRIELEKAMIKPILGHILSSLKFHKFS